MGEGRQTETCIPPFHADMTSAPHHGWAIDTQSLPTIMEPSVGGRRQRQTCRAMLPTDQPSGRWHKQAVETILPPCHEVWMDDVTQGQAIHMASLQQEPTQCAYMWWTDKREGKAERLGIVKRDGTGDSRVARNSLLYVSGQPCHLGPWCGLSLRCC